MNTDTSEDDFSTDIRICSMISDDADVDSFYVEQALIRSLPWSDSHVGSHCFRRAGMTEIATFTLAAARLEWLLQESVHGLDGVIGVDDFSMLCDAIKGEIASPGDSTLATVVADENGLDPETYSQTEFRPLMDKLVELSHLQQLAVRDLVERYWHVGINEYVSMREYLKANGIAG